MLFYMLGIDIINNYLNNKIIIKIKYFSSQHPTVQPIYFFLPGITHIRAEKRKTYSPGVNEKGKILSTQCVHKTL